MSFNEHNVTPNLEDYEISPEFSIEQSIQKNKHLREVSGVSPTQIHFTPTEPLNIKRELSIKKSIIEKEDEQQRPPSMAEINQKRLLAQEKNLSNSKVFQSQNSLNTFVTMDSYATAMESETQLDHVKTPSNTNPALDVEGLVSDINNFQMGTPQASDLYNDDPTPVINQKDTFESSNHDSRVDTNTNYHKTPRPYSYASTPSLDEDLDFRTSLAPPRHYLNRPQHRQSSVYSTIPPALTDYEDTNPQQAISEFDQKQERRRIASEMDVSFHSDFDNETSYTDESKHLHVINGSPTSHDSSFSKKNRIGSSTRTLNQVKDSFKVTAVRGQTTIAQKIGDKVDTPYKPNLSQRNDGELKDKSIQPGDEELYALFLIAIHPFDASSLELQSDSSICLSFLKNDVVFVHTVDSSGWGEVTLIKTLQRGWVPINFFAELIKNDPNLPLQQSRLPLRHLLISAAKFLINPIETDKEQYEEIVDGQLGTNDRISLGLINDIRDGVKYILEKTDCLSRSTEIVRQRPIIRKIRKALLADWYSLMIKADSYKKSKKIQHLETLQIMVLQVVKKSIGFLEIWGIESEELMKQETLLVTEITSSTRKSSKGSIIKSSNQYTINLPKLSTVPFAKERLNEVHTILFSYIGILLGRLDMIEHNPTGCQLLENVTHQMIILLRELLFISKSCYSILHDQKKRILDGEDNLDTLLSLVSELVSSVKKFVTKTINEDFFIGTKRAKIDDNEVYYYSTEGDELINVISKMTRAVSSCVENCEKALKIIGNFKLNGEREFTDFTEIRITPEIFIKRCSLGLIKNFKEQKIDLKSLKRFDVKKQSRYSMIRGGLNNENCLTSAGSNLLQEFLPDSFIRSSVFEPFLNEEETSSYQYKEEIIRDDDGNLLGASLKGLIFLLTNEMSNKDKLDDFFANSFFLTFKLFTNGNDIIEELIIRFNSENIKEEEEIGQFSSIESKLKHRRKLIVKILKLWLQSYWDYENDYNLLPILINFFNETISEFLPIESKKLIELISQIICLTPTKINERTNNNNFELDHFFNNNRMQLVNSKLGSCRNSTVTPSSSMNSINSALNHHLDDDEYIFEEYNLINSQINRNSHIHLPGFHTHNNNTTTFLTKGQFSDLEKLVINYKKLLNWSNNENDLKEILKNWFNLQKLPKNIFFHQFNEDYNLCELNSFEISKQLTLIESKIFCDIKPKELINISKFQKKSFPNAPNVSYSLTFTNMLSDYILDSLLKKGLSIKRRVGRIQNWLNIALSCYYLKNFNTLACIITSLQSAALSRINDLWNELSDKYNKLFIDLKKIINYNHNYKNYRLKIDKFLELESSIPIVPYINLFIQDLTFIDEGNKDYRNSNSFLKAHIINYDKFFKISKIMSNIEFLQVSYDIPQKKSSRFKRSSSIFSFASFTNSNNSFITNIPIVQEYILLELFRVHQLGLDMDSQERFWELSTNLLK